jgi:Tfp pilus assembly PilM family ATPase
LDGLTLLVAQSSNRATIKTVAATPLDLPADADRNDPSVIGPAVKRALDKLGLKASSVVMGVPRSRVILRNLRTPKMEKLAELASLVHFQIGKDLPFRPEEAVIDFKIGDAFSLPPKPGAEPGAAPPAPQVEILAAVVKRDVVDFYQRLAVEAGLNLAGLSLVPYGNYRCAEACEAAPADAVHALVCLRPDEVSVDIMGGRWLWFSRGAAIRIPVEGAASDPARRSGGEDFVSAAAIEVVRSLHSYAGTVPNRPVVRVSVAGATGSEDALVLALQTRLGLPCARLNPASALGLPSELQAAANAATAVIGLALGCGDPDGLRIDFLHPKRPAVQRNMKRIRIVAACAAFVVFLAIVLGVRAKMVGTRATVLESVTSELADAEKKRPAYRKVVNQAAVVEKWAGEGRNCLDQYAALSAILPPSEETYLTSITINSAGLIRLNVEARSAETLARVEKSLRAAGYEVKPLAITPAANRFGYEFRSNVEISAPEKLKVNPRQLKPPERPADDFSLDSRAWKGGAGQ